MIGIYKITSPSGLIYIGQSRNIQCRFSGYRRCRNQSQPALFASFNKYGVENHLFEVIELCALAYLDEREIYYIGIFDSFRNGLNAREGGHRAPLSAASRAKAKAKMLETNKKPEVKERRAAWQRGRKLSEESKAKMRLAKVGKPGHPNQKAAATGNNNASIGRIEIYKDGKLIATAENTYRAAAMIGGQPANVRRSLTSERWKTHLGYSFKRIPNESHPPPVEENP